MFEDLCGKRKMKLAPKKKWDTFSRQKKNGLVSILWKCEEKVYKVLKL